MAEPHDEDDAPMPDAPEPELFGMPPAPASAPPVSNLERCIALRLVYGAGPRLRLQKIATCITSHRLSLLSRVWVVPCVLARTPWFHVLTTSPRHPDSDKPFFCDGLKKCAHKMISVQCPECQSDVNSNKRGCGSLVKAQASARVDMPTDSFFFCCSADQGVQHECKLVCECFEMCMVGNRP